MFPHKKDQSFISTPVSRVGSATRLNQFPGPNGSRPSSRPATPGAYVTSSLNPARNVPVTSHNIRLKLTTPEQLLQFEKVPVVEQLGKFEAAFTELSLSITSFKDEDLESEVAVLIDINHQISHGLGLLESHHNLGTQIKALTKVNEDLDAHSKSVLKELISCRAKLRTLPKLPASHGNTQNLNKVDVQAILDYAMKLAKFSKAPATVLAQFIHPNNYIWPAEDALRRGTLAMASIKPDELIQAEIGTADVPIERAPLPPASDLDVEMEDVGGPATISENVPGLSANTGVSTNGSVPVPPTEPVSKQAPAPAPAPAATLDLDLFDPEDDDDDSD